MTVIAIEHATGRRHHFPDDHSFVTWRKTHRGTDLTVTELTPVPATPTQKATTP